MKEKILLAILMCSMVLLSGCGENTGHENTVSETVISIAHSPLIHADNPEEENMADMLQDASSGVMVQIQNGDVIGSGVLWDVVGDKVVIATAAHVFTMGNGIIEVTFADGWTTPVSGYEVTNTDLAFLFVDLRDVPQEQLAQYQLANVNEESTANLRSGDGIILMASGTGVAADAYEGEVIEPWIYVEDFEEHMIVVRVDAEAGMSGGGLFDYEGHFLGILCGKSEDGEAAVIPVSVIRALYGVF